MMTTKERCDVMLAYDAGKQIQWRPAAKSNPLEDWMNCTDPGWDFSRCDYREKPSPVPPGDLTCEEAEAAFKSGKKVEWCSEKWGFSPWAVIEQWIWCDDRYKTDYAFRLARVPLKPNANLCGKFIRKPSWPAGCTDMIMSVTSEGVYAGFVGKRHARFIAFTELMDYVFPDGTPCSKEEK